MKQQRRRRGTRRVAYSPYATAVLVTAFSISSTPTKEQRQKLAEAIGTTERRVQVWFQNRRQRTSGPVSEGDAASLLAGHAAGDPEVQHDRPQDLGVDDDESDDDNELDGEEEEDEEVTALASGCLPTEAEYAKEGVVKPGMMMEAFTTLFPPFEMMWASGDWLEFCGFERGEVPGLTLKVLQGPETDSNTILALMEAVSRTGSISVRLTNYTRNGIPFTHDIEVQPLTNSCGEPVLYKVRSKNVASLLEQGIARRAELPPSIFHKADSNPLLGGKLEEQSAAPNEASEGGAGELRASAVAAV